MVYPDEKVSFKTENTWEKKGRRCELSVDRHHFLHKKIVSPATMMKHFKEDRQTANRTSPSMDDCTGSYRV